MTSFIALKLSCLNNNYVWMYCESLALLAGSGNKASCNGPRTSLGRLLGQAFFFSAHFTVKVEWYPIYGPKRLFKFGEKGPIASQCYCTCEHKMNFEGFTQNGCYGNQPQPFEVVFFLALTPTLPALSQNKI